LLDPRRTLENTLSVSGTTTMGYEAGKEVKKDLHDSSCSCRNNEWIDSYVYTLKGDSKKKAIDELFIR